MKRMVRIVSREIITDEYSAWLGDDKFWRLVRAGSNSPIRTFRTLAALYVYLDDFIPRPSDPKPNGSMEVCFGG